MKKLNNYKYEVDNIKKLSIFRDKYKDLYYNQENQYINSIKNYYYGN